MSHVNMDTWKRLYHNGTEALALQHNGVCIWAKEQTISGATPLTVQTRQQKSIKEYKPTGKIVQNGTPTPTAIIPVQGVGDRTANLFDKSTITLGHFATLAGMNADNSYYCSDFIPITAAAYYFQNAIGGSYQNTVVVYDANKQGLRYEKLSGTSKVSGAMTFQSGDAYIRVNCYFQTDVDTVVVNLGSTALPYEPYGYKVSITNRGKNLFDGLMEVGNIDAATGEETVDSPRLRTVNYIPVLPSTTYTLTKEAGTAGFVNVVGYDENKNGVTDGEYSSYPARLGGSINYAAITQAFSTTPTTRFIRFYYTNLSECGSVLQISKGSTALPYEPYREPITTTLYTDKPLYGEGTNLDYLQRRADGTGVEHRAYGVKVLDGTEQWYGSAKYRTTLSGQIGTVKPICTHYVGVTTASYADVQNGQITVNGEVGRTLCIADSTNQTSIEDWKAYLASEYAAGHPVTVWYVLATPTDTPVTLPEIPTAVGTNVLDTDTTVKPTSLSVVAR